MTTQVTTVNAKEYVRDYFKGEVNITRVIPRGDLVEVFFVIPLDYKEDDYDGMFTVWVEEGKLYGEW